jgi:hypothetical protein
MTLPLLAYSPPVAKDGVVEVALHADGRLVRLAGAAALWAALARDILFLPREPEPAPRKPEPPPPPNAETLAAYRRVVARVHAGERWHKAAEAEGAPPQRRALVVAARERPRPRRRRRAPPFSNPAARCCERAAV